MRLRPPTAILTFAAVLFAIPARAAPESPRDLAAAHMPHADTYTLPNGLRVILHEDHRAPVVTVNVWYHVGSKDEPQGKNGFAHLFEHLMFQGSKNVGEDMYFRYLERAGSTESNGSTNLDRTNYYEQVPKTQLPLALWLESDRMATLLDHVNQATFESQREVVKNERRQSYENRPYGLLHKFVQEALFPEGHPYHRLTIGTPEDLDAAKLEDVQAFYRKWYVPNNASLVVAGDIEPAHAKELIAQYFGTIPASADPKPLTEPQDVKLTGTRKLSVEADVELARLSVSWVTPPEFRKGDGELDIISHVLGGGKSSRLYKRLVHDLQIAQDVAAYQASEQLASHFAIETTLRPGHSPEEALKVIDEELAKLRSAPLPAAELERARTVIVTDHVLSVEALGHRADRFNQYAQFNGDPNAFAADAARYETATAADVQATATNFLPPDRRIIAIVTPNKTAPRAGRLVKTEELNVTVKGASK